MNIKYSKKEKFLIIFYLVMIIFLGVGITFSFYLLASSAEDDSSRVYAGRLDVNYIQGNEVTADTLYPIASVDFNTVENVYRNRFSVGTDGTLEQNVEIGFNITKSEFSNDMVRYTLFSGAGVELSTGYLNEGFVTMQDNLYFKEIETRDFVLIIWLEEKPFEQSEEQGNRLFGKIVINSKQYGY